LFVKDRTTADKGARGLAEAVGLARRGGGGRKARIGGEAEVVVGGEIDQATAGVLDDWTLAGQRRGEATEEVGFAKGGKLVVDPVEGVHWHIGTRVSRRW
jgi:hypothetical protein